MTTIHSDYETLCSYRKGACFSKMDLHTHTPASECSSYTLPAPIDRVLPDKNDTAAWKILLEQASSGCNLFSSNAELNQRPGMSPLPSPDCDSIRKIASVWLTDISQLPTTSDSFNKDTEKIIKQAMVDIRNYLASLYFPEE